MRDFRDAKAMARTLRATLAAKGFKITISQSLELIAEIFGEADWNTLAAAIRAKGTAPRGDHSPSSPPTAEGGLLFSHALECTPKGSGLRQPATPRARDAGASPARSHGRTRCFAALRARLTSYIDDELRALAKPYGDDAAPTSAFQRVIQRAVIHVQSSSGKEVTGANVLVAIFAERESHAAYFMEEQDMTHHDAVSYISHGIVKGSEDAVTNHRRRRSPIPPEAEEMGKLRQTFSHGRTKPVEVEKIKRRRRPRDGKAAKDAK